MKCVATRQRRVMSQFFGFTGLLISLLDELVFSCVTAPIFSVSERVEIKRGLIDMALMSESLGLCPLDSFRITVLLVNPTAQFWCRGREVLVCFC